MQAVLLQDGRLSLDDGAIVIGPGAARYAALMQAFCRHDAIALSAVHAPAGYNEAKPLVIAGHSYLGGNFIPGAVVAQATPAEKAKLGLPAKEDEKEPEHVPPPGYGGHPWAKGTPRHDVTYAVPLEHMHVDPERFQYKKNADEKTGVTKDLSEEGYDPDRAGEVAVWKDPENGKTYIVDGHHRREIAENHGVAWMEARYIKAKTAEEAKAIGAKMNGHVEVAPVEAKAEPAESRADVVKAAAAPSVEPEPAPPLNMSPAAKEFIKKDRVYQAALKSKNPAGTKIAMAAALAEFHKQNPVSPKEEAAKQEALAKAAEAHRNRPQPSRGGMSEHSGALADGPAEPKNDDRLPDEWWKTLMKARSAALTLGVKPPTEEWNDTDKIVAHVQEFLRQEKAPGKLIVKDLRSGQETVIPEKPRAEEPAKITPKPVAPPKNAVKSKDHHAFVGKHEYIKVGKRLYKATLGAKINPKTGNRAGATLTSNGALEKHQQAEAKKIAKLAPASVGQAERLPDTTPPVPLEPLEKSHAQEKTPVDAPEPQGHDHLGHAQVGDVQPGANGRGDQKAPDDAEPTEHETLVKEAAEGHGDVAEMTGKVPAAAKPKEPLFTGETVGDDGKTYYFVNGKPVKGPEEVEQAKAETKAIAKKSRRAEGRKEIANALHARLDPIMWMSSSFDAETSAKIDGLDRAITVLRRGTNGGEKLSPEEYAAWHAIVAAGIAEVEQAAAILQKPEPIDTDLEPVPEETLTEEIDDDDDELAGESKGSREARLPAGEQLGDDAGPALGKMLPGTGAGIGGEPASVPASADVRGDAVLRAPSRDQGTPNQTAEEPDLAPAAQGTGVFGRAWISRGPTRWRREQGTRRQQPCNCC